jgi:hypothetical protein
MAEDKVAEELSEVKLTEAGADDDVVDPWNVTSKSDTGIDYDKLISEFGLVFVFNLLMNDVNFQSGLAALKLTQLSSRGSRK